MGQLDQELHSTIAMSQAIADIKELKNPTKYVITDYNMPCTHRILPYGK